MTTTITQDDVLHLAELSHIQLSDEQTMALQADLTNILGHIDELAELDTTGVEPTYQVTDLENIGRDDVVQTSAVNREALLALAPDSKDNQVKVPKVL